MNLVKCQTDLHFRTEGVQYIKNFCPPAFDAFEFLPSVGASGGMITIWKSAYFEGHLAFHNSFSLSVDFRSLHNNAEWLLTNIYGPCPNDGKHSLVEWLKNVAMHEEIDWLLVGDFNLMRSPANRNKPGGDVTHILMFDEAISALGLVELPLFGQQFTWSNKQFEPLLKRLDWFFTSNSWTLTYPNKKYHPCSWKFLIIHHVLSIFPLIYQKEKISF